MAERTTTRAVPGSTLPLRLVAAVAAALLLASLFAPAAGAVAERMFLVPAGGDLPTGVRVIGELPVADALVVSATTAPADAVAYDEPVEFHALLEGDDLPDAGGFPVDAIDSGVASTGAPKLWDEMQGKRTVVALVDTGVAPIPALQEAMAGEIDFTGTGGGDGYGHGTFMASLIAARGPVAPGVAPGTGILSLKVAEDDGSSTLGTVMSALQWLYGPGRGVGVRIATLALGVDSDSPAGELLDLATGRLAADGVLVVTATGNTKDELTSPATSPGTFSVGAVDDQGTPDRVDDEIAVFSGSGEDHAGVSQPDIHAAGVGVVGWMARDALISQSNPDAEIPHASVDPDEDLGQLIRGSGTSMSTALTAGVAALVLSERPDLDGAALHEALRSADGELDAPATLAALQAMDERPAPQPGQRPATPPGHAEGHPGNGNANGQSNGDGQSKGKSNGQGNGKGVGDGPADPQNVRWHNVRWHNVRWHNVRWHNVRWHNVRWHEEQWEPERWGHIRWGAIDWQNVRWHNVRWHNVRWHGHWGGADWQWAEWANVRWHDTKGWQGVDWEGVDFESERWGNVRWHALESTPVQWAWLDG